ncbi:MAG: multiheme c-type cytochrome [Armatimonadota bacterium]|nr:cytochrome c family protein [Armatimonadota bacterium]MCX7777174.1 cytochrome c family protein [Armatimonadota bacterium]MDW8025001.1 multiheme c-type cytochrome [Armatimonadota bacterium]
MRGVIFCVIACAVILAVFSGRFTFAQYAKPVKVPIRGACQTCHKAHADEWLKSAHARAWISELFKEMSDNYEREECLHCHAPERLLDTGFGKEPKLRDRTREGGVDCSACHADLKGRMHGPYEIEREFHENVKNEEIGTVEMCASCHYKFGTVSEFKETKWGKDPKGCVECHMPKVERPIGEMPLVEKKYPVRFSRVHTFRSVDDIEFVKESLKLEAAVDGDKLIVKLSSINVGHKFPTGFNVNAAVIDVSLLDGDKQLLSFKHLLSDERPQGKDTRLLPEETLTLSYPLEGKKGTAVVRLLYKRPKTLPDEKALELLKVEVPVK